MFGHKGGYAALFIGEKKFTLVIYDIFRTQRHTHATVEALYLAFVRQLVDIAAHGLRGHVELLGQFLDGGIATLIEEIQEVLSSIIGSVHTKSYVWSSKKLKGRLRYGKKGACDLCSSDFCRLNMHHLNTEFSFLKMPF